MPTENFGIFILALILSAGCGYLLGSINSAILLCRIFYGKDPRAMGSGNAGMTNVLRNFGKLAGALTLLGDALKGALAVLAGRLFIVLLCPGTDTLYGAYIGAIFALLGHLFPLYFGFKGGKGIASSLGIILFLQPVLALSLLGLFLIIFAISKMVSLGSIVAISLYPVCTLLWCLFISGQDAVFSTVCATLFAIMVVWMHRGNIKRILNGTEYKFGQKKAEEAAEAPAETEAETPTDTSAGGKAR